MPISVTTLLTKAPHARNALFVVGFSLLLTACNSSGSNSVDSTLDLTQDNNQQIASVPQADQYQDPRAYCPKAVLRAGTETYNVYPDGVTKDDQDASGKLLYRSTISEIARECNRAGSNLNIKVGVRGRLITGPSGQAGSFNMPIRVAVTRGDEVLYSQLHQVPAVLEPGRPNSTFSYVDGNISFPIPERENVIVYVGFDEGPYDTE